MRIAFLCKRRYMRKDVIADRYGRLYEIPHQLARHGHNVLALCLDYHVRGKTSEAHNAGEGRLGWLGFDTAPLRPLGTLTYPLRALRVLRSFSPEILIGASDALHVVLTAWLARRLGCAYALDLYDNFESFGLTRWLGLTHPYRRAVAGAVWVSCVSQPLADFVQSRYRPRGPVLALPSTIDTANFEPVNKSEARRRLGLPVAATLIGTAGGLHADKGIDTLYRAFESLRQRGRALHLVLAGGLDRRCPPPNGERVHYLGELPQPMMATLFSALDVGVVYLRNTEFGRFCFPQKAYEMLACGLPLVAARVGVMCDLLQQIPSALYEPDDATSLAACIEHQIVHRQRPMVEISGWHEFGQQLNAALQAATAP